MPRDENLGQDIAKILEEVKLPARRSESVPGSAANPNPPEPRKFDTALSSPGETTASDPAPEVQPSAEGIVTPRQAEKGASGVTPVHTLKDDLRDVVHDTKMSVVRAAALEQDRRTRRPTEKKQEHPASAQRSRRTAGILFGVAVLLLLGFAALFGVYVIMRERQGQPIPDTSSALLFSEQSVALSLDGQSPSGLKRLLAGARDSSSGTLGSITRIIPLITETLPDGTAQQRPATFGEFVGALGTHAPADLLRALGDDFFLGIHTVDKNALLLIVPVISYDRAFAGMLRWEPLMNADLAPAFPAVPANTIDARGLPVRRTFTDLVMRNYDARALKDDSGGIQLYYSFPSRQVLVIAESPYSFAEILSRLQAKRML